MNTQGRRTVGDIVVGLIEVSIVGLLILREVLLRDRIIDNEEYTKCHSWKDWHSSFHTYTNRLTQLP